MNKIELEWQQLKNHELVGKMFEDELDLAYALIDGIEAEENEEIIQLIALNLVPVPALNIYLLTLVFLCRPT